MNYHKRNRDRIKGGENNYISKEEHLKKHENMVVGLDNLEIGRKYNYMNKDLGKRFEGILFGIFHTMGEKELVGVFYIDSKDEYELKWLGDLGVISYDEEDEVWNHSTYLVETDHFEEVELDQEEVKNIVEESRVPEIELETF